MTKKVSRKSSVFEHFTKTTDGKYYVCQCIVKDVDCTKTCNAKLSSFSGSDKKAPTRASNLKRHLHRFHPKVLETVNEKDSNCISYTSGLKKDQKTTTADQSKVTLSKFFTSNQVTVTITPEKFKNYIMEMTMKNGVPLSVFSQPAFLGLNGEMARKLGISLESDSLRRIFEECKLPDLSERMGSEGPPNPCKMEGASNYLTCAPIISSMPGMHEDLGTGAGPSSAHQDPIDGEGGPSYETEMIDVKAEPVFNVEPEICDDENSQNNTQSSSGPRSSQSSPTPGMTGPYLLKKETHCTTILDQLLRDDTFSDVTLTAEGQSIRAHKIVLCLASAYFRQVLNKETNVQNVIVFRDVKFTELKNLINFIYTGEATVDAAELESFMKTAEMLEVTSLCDGQRNLPKSFLPKPRESEVEKPKASTVSKRGAAHHSNISAASPPTKSRKLDYSPATSKVHKTPSYPSTSGSGSVIIPSPVPVIKSEPDPDDPPSMEGLDPQETEECFDTLQKSPSHFPEPERSTSLERTPERNSSEKVLPGRCPFCPNSHQLRKGTALHRHIQLNHPDQSFFFCDTCSRVFLVQSSFEAHREDCVR